MNSNIPPISGSSASSNNDSSNHEESVDVDIEIISKDKIKPASPTPDHSRIHKLSILDQLSPHMYANPLIFFYSNSNQSSSIEQTNNFIAERRQCLKRSLSEALVQFYPLAGKIRDNLHVQCNDDGVYYVEARVKTLLSNFLVKPENRSINQLFPYDPSSSELLSETHLILIQVSFFACGGISIGVYISHKVGDALSLVTFMKAWAAKACKDSAEQTIYPSFISPFVFPSDPSLHNDSYMVVPNPTKEHNYVTSRFVFNSLALATLKSKAMVNSSSVTATMGLLWKSFIATTYARCPTPKHFILALQVNLRQRSSPPLPLDSFGNIFWMAFAKCSAKNSDVELQTLVNKIRSAIGTINSGFVEDIKGENKILKLMGPLKDLGEFCSTNSVGSFAITSLCKIGVYDADFGKGKPIWSCTGSRRTNLYGLKNLALLMDTKSGDGIEAWVTLKEEEMDIFEKNSDLLVYASVNPCPL